MLRHYTHKYIKTYPCPYTVLNWYINTYYYYSIHTHIYIVRVNNNNNNIVISGVYVGNSLEHINATRKTNTFQVRMWMFCSGLALSLS